MASLNGLPWLDDTEAFDFLRVGEENINVIQALTISIPDYIEACTGYPATKTSSEEPDEIVRPLALFLLQLWYNPDGTDSRQLTRVVQSLEKTVRAYVVSERRGDTDGE